jgi:hypothetical protein
VAFPILETASLVADAANTTNHLWTYPTGIEEGDLLLGLLILDSGTAPVLGNFPSGWTLIVKDNWHISASAQSGYKWADGTETGNFTTSSSNNDRACTVILRISGADTAINPVWVKAESLTGNNPDPPNNAPGVGTKDFLWCVLEGHDGGNDTVTVFPSNMTGATGQIGNGSNGTRVSYAVHGENAASFNPNAMTISGTGEAWYVYTIAVQALETADEILPGFTNYTFTSYAPTIETGVSITADLTNYTFLEYIPAYTSDPDVDIMVPFSNFTIRIFNFDIETTLQTFNLLGYSPNVGTSAFIDIEDFTNYTFQWLLPLTAEAWDEIIDEEDAEIWVEILDY